MSPYGDVTGVDRDVGGLATAPEPGPYRITWPPHSLSVRAGQHGGRQRSGGDAFFLHFTLELRLIIESCLAVELKYHDNPYTSHAFKTLSL